MGEGAEVSVEANVFLSELLLMIEAGIEFVECWLVYDVFVHQQFVLHGFIIITHGDVFPDGIVASSVEWGWGEAMLLHVFHHALCGWVKINDGDGFVDVNVTHFQTPYLKRLYFLWLALSPVHIFNYRLVWAVLCSLHHMFTISS